MNTPDAGTDLPADSIALRPYPSKIFVEITTRCNLRCGMCVKETRGCGIIEGDLTGETFAALESALPRTDTLILNGIGEPLLHPHLETFVRRARLLMAEGSSIGFQSNGMLLDYRRSTALVEAGLDRICLSIDAISPETYRRLRKGAEVHGIERAFAVLAKTKKNNPRSRLSIGVEFVLSRDTMRELQSTLRWAAERGAEFAIVTHMISYDASVSSKVVYDQNTDDALDLFREWKDRGNREGVDITRYFDVAWKYIKSEKERKIVELVGRLHHEAASRGVDLHFRNLVEQDESFRTELGHIFDEARSVAKETGIDLRLPALSPRGRKYCEFIESGSTFVSWKGEVHPCYFLWHGYNCFASGWRKFVNPKVFGNLSEHGIIEIWNDPEYRSFRQSVLSYNYPLCSNCNLAPCDYIDSEVFEQDCYINAIPCCDCQWCLGVFQCMQ
jgi:putative metalloenzyme radical SAM/SPASM domain maturase